MFNLAALELSLDIEELRQLGLCSEEIDGYVCFYWDSYLDQLDKNRSQNEEYLNQQ